MTRWRRVSDWKHDVTLVSAADVAPLLAAEGWTLPADRVASRWPRLAALAREAGLVRVEAAVARRLVARGIVTHRVGYHRVSDGFLYARTGPRPARHDLDAGGLLGEVVDLDDDDAWDAARDTFVDALLRVVSDGVVTERAVLLAEALPALGNDEVDAARLDALEPSEDGLPPREAPGLLEDVRAALARGPRPVQVDRVAVRRNLAKALGFGVAGLLVAFFTHERAPMIAAIAGALGGAGLLIALLVVVGARGRGR